MSFLGVSILNIVLLYYFARQHDIFANLWYIIVVFVGEGFLWLLYQLVFYPRLLSPLRSLPEPKVRAQR